MDKRNKRFRKKKLLKTEFKLQKFVLPSISLKNCIFLLYPSEAQKCPVTAGWTRVHRSAAWAVESTGLKTPRPTAVSSTAQQCSLSHILLSGKLINIWIKSAEAVPSSYCKLPKGILSWYSTMLSSLPNQSHQKYGQECEDSLSSLSLPGQVYT